MSLVQLIKDRLTEAIIKVSCENPAFDREGEPTAEEARDSFIALLMAELFPVHGNEAAAVVEVPVVEPEPVVVPAKKLTKEEKAAEKAAKEAAKAEAKAAKEAEKAAKEAAKEAAAKAKEEAKAAKEAAKAAKAASPKKSPEEKAAEKEAAAKAKAEAKEAEKAAAKAAKEAEKEAAKAAKEAEKAAKAEAKAAKKSPKAADVALPVSPKAAANVPKIDPTWRKLLKEADKEHAKELEPELLKYLNSISNAVFNDKPARQHVTEFLAARQPVAEPEPAGPVDLEVVEFNGQDYYVNPETKRVYEGVMSEDGELKITRPVGYVGMADFKDMVLDEEDDE